MSNNNSKEHYKMYKDGKRWVFASISVMTVMLTGAFHADNVHADTTDDTNSEISNNNTTNYLSQSQVVLDNRPAAKGGNLPASKDKQVTTPTDSEGDKNNIDILNNEVKTDEQIKDNSSNISSVSSNAEVTTVKAESSLNNADSHKSVATSDAMSVNSASVANSSEAIITSSATDANSAVTANSSETIITSSATGANSAVTTNSSAVSVNNEVTATSSVTSANSAVAANSSEASLNSEAVVNSNVANVDSEATTTNGVDISRNNVVLHSSSVTDNDIQKVNMVSRTEVTPQITSSIHVSNWDEFTNALTNKDINEIIVDNNITATNSNSQTIAVRDNNTLLIRSNDDGRYAIDFRSAYPKGQLNLTYENIDLYGMVYYGVINTNVGLSSAPSSITFRNTSYTGAQLVYAGDSTTIIFQGKNSIKTVDSYTSLVDGSMVSVGNSQQALEFTGKDDHIIFDENSIFEGSTFKDNVIRMTGNNSSITVKKGAVVTLTPHDNGTGLGGSAEWGSKANGIYMSGSGVLTVENGGTLNINAGENSSQGVAAISITDPNTTVHINEGGTININVTGNISSYSGSGQSANTAVYINGQLKTDYGASFNVNGYDMGTFSGTLVKISGNAKLLGSTFKISLDDATSGTGTIILLDAGGNVSIENPKDFLLHLGTNSQAQWIKNGSFSLSKARLKTNNTTTGPFKTISFTIRDGNILVTDADSKNIIGLTQADENSLISLLDQLGSDESIASLEFVQANDEVEIIDNNVTITKENGNYLEVSGYTDIPGAYIHATINGNEFAGQKLDSPYWRENGIDSTVVYAAQSSMVKDPNGKGYKFTFEIPNDIVNTLAPGAMIDLYATFNFVDSDIVSADLGILGVQQYKDNVNLAANDAISHINGLTNLTDQQKERLVSQVDTIVTNTSDKFIDDVSQNSTNTAIYNSFIDDLNTITGLADGQDNAMNLLQTAAENTINDIENIDGLTSTQISDYESQINNVRNDAILEIGQTLSPEDALTAEQNGEISFTNIKNAAKLQAAKNDGIAKLDEAKNTTIAQITESGLSADRQTALINAVNEAHDTAVDKVTADTTIAQVNQDTTDGVNAINSIAGTVTEESEALQAAQETAQNAINAAAEAAKNDINNNASLTADEKHDLVAAVDEAVNTAKNQIAQATSPDEVTEATQTGEANITAVSDDAKLQAAKNDALAAIDTAATNAITAIENNTSLTTAQKDAYKAQITNAATDAKNAINQATNVADVTTAEDAGTANISAVSDTAKLQAAKNDAVSVVDTAATNAIAAIENNTSLTAGQKDAYKAQITNAATDAKNDINQVTNVADVTTAEDAGEANIAVVSDDAKLQAAKNDGIAKLDEAKNTTIAQITESGLSADRQTALINAVNEAHDTAVDKVTADTTIAQANQDTTDGVNAINSIAGTVTEESEALQAAQETAQNAINAAAEAAKNDINNNASLTADEKHDLVATVDAAANTAKDQIAQATSPDEATEATQTGEANIAVVSDAAKLQAAKNDGIAKLDEAKDATIAQIKQSGLSTDRQTALINAVNEAHDTAVDKVTADTTIAQANQDTTDGVNAINSIAGTVTEESEALQAAQETAQNAINAAAEAAKDDINNNASLTADEKHDLVAAVDAAANTAKDQIAQATSPDEATEATENGEANIAAVSDVAKLQAAKNDGIVKLDEAKNTTIAQITESGLSADRQTALINAVNETHDTAVDQVTADTTIAQANQDTTDGVDAINGIAGTVTEESEALQAAQETAQNAINAAAEAAKDDINNNASLTADEKDDLMAAVDEAANTAQDQIAQATSPDEATEATQTGEANIAVVSDAAKLQAAKNDAVSVIDTAATNAIAAIENNKSLTTAQKDAYKAQITNAVTDAKNAINQATNVADVTTAENAGVANISAVSDDAKLQAAKNDAVAAIDTAATNAIAAIENNTSLTAGQKDAYKAQITNAATDAKNAINQATNAADVTTAEDAGAANISAVSDAAKLQAAKNDGIAKLDEAKDATIAQIKQSGLSTDRQTALINAVNEAYDTAVDQVTAGTTIVQVNQDTMNGVNAISNIADTVTEESETLKAEQEAAKNKLNQIAQAAIKVIKQNSNLTDKEKQSFINEILQIVANSNNTIINAISAQKVVIAEQNGEMAINNISDAAKLQATKNKAIAKINDVKTSVINKIKDSVLNINKQSSLINIVNKIYNDVRNNINNGVTIEQVVKNMNDGINKIIAMLDLLNSEFSQVNDEQCVINYEDSTKNSNDMVNKLVLNNSAYNQINDGNSKDNKTLNLPNTNVDFNDKTNFNSLLEELLGLMVMLSLGGILRKNKNKSE